MRVFVLTALLLLAACGRTALIDQSGRTHTGNYNSISKEVSFNVDGKLYKGFYIVNSGVATINSNTFGRNPSFSSGQIYMPGSSGQAILRAGDGATLRCEFQYQGQSAIGSCVDLKGQTYQMMAGM